MKPDENSSSQGGTPLLPQRSMAVAPKTGELSHDAQSAAAKIILSKIDNLFDQQSSTDTKTDDTNPYERTHTDKEEIQTADWKQYHTAWQDYYQKYYEGYYTHHVKAAKEKLLADQSSNDNITPDEATFDLHQQLVGKVRDSATKVRKSRHFIPIISGLAVVLAFLFMQYNQLLIANVMAYVSPGNIDPQNIVIDPTANITVSPEPRLIIPKINVDVPVSYDIGNDNASQMAAMKKGVAHFAIPGASSHPGQVGNTVIAGHSSNDLFSAGDYKFIFAQLEKLSVGDTIYINYNSKRYSYTVVRQEVVGPTDVSKLVYETNKPMLTLLTCTPVGTATNRLLVTAEQISPDPTQSAAAPTKSSDSKLDQSSIPGNSPTLIEQLFGLGN
ncbi:MAG: sortase [Candidatus Saccharibacteria bacterium]